MFASNGVALGASRDYVGEHAGHVFPRRGQRFKNGKHIVCEQMGETSARCIGRICGIAARRGCWTADYT